jgi:hypothetical protein
MKAYKPGMRSGHAKKKKVKKYRGGTGVVDSSTQVRSSSFSKTAGSLYKGGGSVK